MVLSNERTIFFRTVSAGIGGVGFAGNCSWARATASAMGRLAFSPASRRATSTVKRCWCENERASAIHVRAEKTTTCGELAHNQAPSSSQNGHCGEGEVRWRELTLMTTTAAPDELQQVLKFPDGPIGRISRLTGTAGQDPWSG